MIRNSSFYLICWDDQRSLLSRRALIHCMLVLFDHFTFIEEFARLTICLIRYSVLSKSGKTSYFRTIFSLLLTMFSVSYIYCLQIARLHCVCLSHRGCFIWVTFVKIPKQKFESLLASSTRAMFSDKARCFSQSERTLYGNFTINNYKKLNQS